jgi:hypothetical protein
MSSSSKALLRSIELFAAGAELPALKHGDLVGQLLNARRAPDQLAILGLEFAVGVDSRAINADANVRNSASPSCWSWSLLSMGRQCAERRWARLLAHALIEETGLLGPAQTKGNSAVFSQALPRQAEDQRPVRA